MKIINKAQVEAYETNKPQPITVKQHKGEEPKEVAKNVVVMPGDYHTDDGIVISAADIEGDGAWKVVEK